MDHYCNSCLFLVFLWKKVFGLFLVFLCQKVFGTSVAARGLCTALCNVPAEHAQRLARGGPDRLLVHGADRVGAEAPHVNQSAHPPGPHWP